jgi:CDP-diacylglycerol pyrophosphatase
MPNPKSSLALVALGLLFASPARAQNPDALWNILHNRCVPNVIATGDASPCVEVDQPNATPSGWVVLKDINGATQFLVMPTQKITGIEDPLVLQPGEPNFFAAAWEARRFFLARVGHGVPQGVISLTINSPTGRTQNQLHIHIDCLRADIRDTLAGALGSIGADFTPLPLAGHPYRARRLNGPDLTDNPFLLLAAETPPDAMGRHTLAVVAERFPDGKDGFVLLDDEADLLHGDRASSEELQDHACAVLH